MRDFGELLQNVILKKNKGYIRHRYHVPEDKKQFFTKSMEITSSDVEIAISILKTINIQNKEDMFLGLTCIKLLSAYEKRQQLIAEHSGKEFKSKLHENNCYFYKQYVNRFIIQGLKRKIDFTFDEHKDKDSSVTYITISGIQFSFHNCDSDYIKQFAKENNLKQYKEQEWDNSVSFQNAAKDVFLYALHLKNLTELDYIHQKPIDYARDVHRGLYKRDDDGKNKV